MLVVGLSVRFGGMHRRIDMLWWCVQRVQLQRVTAGVLSNDGFMLMISTALAPESHQG
jgi:hypothetical protein